jgi:ATP-dependent Clp protease ATP-binding subunit ClpC
MADEIQALIDSLRRGQYEDPAEKIGLLSAALQEQKADIALLLNLLRAPQIPLRLAAMDACRERTEPELVAALVSLADNSESRVRLRLAEILKHHSGDGATDALHTLLKDSDEDVREAAIKSTAGRSEFRAAQQSALASDTDWSVRLAAANALDSLKDPQVVKPLFQALLHDSDEDVRRRCGEIIERRFGETQADTERQLPSEIAELSKAEKALKKLGSHRFPKLIAWIAARTTVSVNPEVLEEFGTDLTALAANGTLPRAHFAEESCDTVLKLIQREPWRSIALLGPTGVGKTALVNELTYQLAKPENGAWRVLRVSPADFMSGTKYLGEWETKVNNLVEAIKKPRRVILYVPNLSDLSAAGTWSKSDSSVATALAPYLEEGAVLLLGESAPQEFERGLGANPSLARLFDKVLVAESSVECARAILTAVRNEEKSAVSDDVLDQLMEVSSQFLSHISRPGNAVELLKTAIKHEKESGKACTFRDILNLLSKSTGVPADLLDDAIPLDGAALREFFEKKIIGQPEAVDAVVDLVTLIKAGVTDPNKPFGVFLFVGPTGVGKTELARALAEFIFGDPARLKRFDMSEFASTDGFTRLIGGNRENGLLTDAVRQHPFSVVLLDEIEKAHTNVFDLCLQLFDAGRLTDGRGRTVDFRRTIVILTSNIGATAGSPPLGFVTPADSKPAEVDKDRTFRELSRFFRPEFLNRLDRIISFRSLSLQVAEQIARREVDLVLQRSGIRRRQLVVDIDPVVFSLLVREGYSPHFGARPLKRTVEQLLLLPLARAISTGSLRERTILRLTEKNGRVEAIVATAPAAKPAKSPQPAQPLAPLRAQFDELQARYAEINRSMQPLVDRKSELITQTQQPNFFRQAEVRSATLGEIHNLDQFLHLHQGVGKALAGIEDRFHRNTITKSDESSVREKLDRLAAEIAHLNFVSQSKDSRDLGDALVTLSLLDRAGATQDAVQRLAAMYQALAKRRGMTAEVLGEFFDEKRDRVYLLVSGLGAYALLKNEFGLHQVDRRFKDRTPRSGREVMREDRELIRVEVHPAGSETPKQLRQRVKTKITPLKPIRKRLLKSELALSVFDGDSVRSVEFWTTGPKNDALERALAILHAQATAGGNLPSQDSIVRHYDVGISPKVKDTRTGRTTTRLDQVMNGELGIFLEPEAN